MTYKDKVCKRCSSTFSPNSSNQLFCSSKCNYADKRIKVLNWKKNNKELYSKKLKEYNYNRKLKKHKEGKVVLDFSTRTCIVCSNSFKPTTANKKYCSKECVKVVDKNYKKEERLKDLNKYRMKDKAQYYKDINYSRNLKNRNSKIRRYNDINVRLLINLRSRFYNVLKGKKDDSILNIIGCSLDYLKKHLESKFDEKMTWENYGFYGWHVDHIKPCKNFNFTKQEDINKCFHYTNLQPLWMKDNLSKGAKYEN